jgi:glutathione S-transferase
MALTLYGTPRTRTTRTLWMLAELGVPYAHVPTVPGDEGTRTPAFLAVNPMGQVPALDDDGLVVFESLAINLHLARRFGGPLAPRDGTEETRATMWSLWAATSLEPDAHLVLLHTVNLPEDRRDPAVRAAAEARLARPMDALAGALAAGGGHLMGGRFTVADLNVACVAFYLRAVPDFVARWPAIRDWYAAATARPGFREMLRLRGDL